MSLSDPEASIKTASMARRVKAAKAEDPELPADVDAAALEAGLEAVASKLKWNRAQV